MFIKIFVSGFYKANAGLFTLSLLFLFGMLRMNEHILIARFFLGSYSLMLFPLLLWVLYNINVLYHLHSLVRIPQNSFLVDLMQAGKRNIYPGAILVQVLVFCPVILYGLFLASLAFESYLWFTLILVLITVSILLILNTLYFIRLVCRSYNAFPATKVYPGSNRKKALSLEQQYFYHTVLSDPVRLFLSKTFSLAVMIAVFYLYSSDDYKFSLITIGILFSSVINGLLVYDMHDFFENKYSFLRNLPVPVIKKSMKDLYILFILMLPELVAIIRNSSSLGFTKVVEVVFLMLSLLFLIKTLLLIRPVDMETFMKWLVYGFIISTFILLYLPPISLTVISTLIFSGLIYRYLYYRYDPVIHTPDTN